MGPERFVAATAAEALKQVRRALGPDAMVLSTKETADGVEIMAITPDALDQLSSGAMRQGASSGGGSGSSGFSGELYSAPPRRSGTAAPATPHELVISDVIKSQRNLDGSPVYTPEQLGRGKSGEPAAASAAAKSSAARDAEVAASALAAASANAAEMNRLVLQMAEVKNLLQSHLASNFWSNLQQNAPAHADVVKTLINAGFSPKLCADIVQAIPKEGDTAVLLKRVSDIVEADWRGQDHLGGQGRRPLRAALWPQSGGLTDHRHLSYWRPRAAESLCQDSWPAGRLGAR
jgi:flagellar biosynthesis protein FlhF